MYDLQLKLEKKFGKIPFTIIGDTMVTSLTYVKVIDSYGEYIIRANHLVNGILPSIKSCIDKNNYLKLKFENIYGKKYDYKEIEYINSKTRLKIKCFLHGYFYKNATKHLGGQECSQCYESKHHRKTVEKFIDDALRVHGDVYDYSKVRYIAGDKKISIICKEHGLFFQTPNNHLDKKGCMKCSHKKVSLLNSENNSGWNLRNWNKRAKLSKDFKNYQVYIVKLYNEKEAFYKVGRTFRSIKRRFSLVPYTYEILKVYEFSTAKEAWDKEVDLKKLIKTDKYKPKISFCGSTECFKDILTLKSIYKQDG